MRLRRREASTHRIHGDVTRAQGTPRLNASVPFVLAKTLNADPGINAKMCTIAASLLKIPMELLDGGLDAVVRWPASRHPPIPEARRALEHRLCRTTKPDGDRTLYRQWINASIINDVVGALVGDQRLRPELAQDLDLLFSAAPTRLKFLAERIVLDVIPADANAETQPSTAQDIDLSGLLGDQGRLALRQNENARHQFEPGGDGGEKSKEHHGLM